MSGASRSDAPEQQNTHGRPPTHGHNSRVRVLKNRGLDAINGRTRAGKEAKRWKAWVMAQKGNGKRSPRDRACDAEKREKRAERVGASRREKAGIRDEFRARPTAALARNDNDAGAKKKHEGFQH
jgi:hypothetical protein